MTTRRQEQAGNTREMVGVALPMVVSLSCDTVMVFTDRWFVSRLGSTAMNAVFVGGLAAFSAQTFFTGLIGYSTALVGQQLGAGRQRHCVLAAYQAIMLSLLAWPAMLPLLLAGNAVFLRVGLPPAQVPEAIEYFDWLLAGSVFGLLRGAFSGFFSGIGRTGIVMVASLVSMCVNVLFVWCLVFGKFGIPALGVKGAAIGTLAASAVGCTVMAIAFVSKGGAPSLGRMPSFQLNRRLMAELLRKGTPSGVEFFLNMMAFQCIVLLFQRRGEVSATAASIMFNWDMVSFVPLVGLEIGVTSLVGRYVGARHHAAVRRTLRSGLRLGWLFSACVFVAFSIFPDRLVEVFASAQPTATFIEARDLAVRMVRVASVYVCIEALLLVYTGALRGAGDTLFAMIASNGLHWFLALVLWIALEVLHLPTHTGWVVLVAVFSLFPVVYGLRWRTGRWRRTSLPGTSGQDHLAPLPQGMPSDFYQQR